MVKLFDPHRGIVQGPSQLYGEKMESPDIRAGNAPRAFGVALLLATLSARGRSIIHNIGQIERGYERVDEKLKALRANIQRVME